MNYKQRKDNQYLFVLMLILISAQGIRLYGQQIPYYPVSLKIYDPFILNPAIAGSKDFFHLDLSAGKSAGINSQFLAGSSRIMKRHREYRAFPELNNFTDFGTGGYVFREKYGLYSNAGFAGTFSYHIKISEDALSFVSAGITGKIIHTSYSGEPDLNIAAVKSTYPDADIGIYYYSPSFYAGVSALNLFSDISSIDSSSYKAAGLSRHLNAIIGYKQVISRNFNIVIEPSLLISEKYSLSGDLKEMVGPMVSLYAGMFCAGAYFPGLNKSSLFFRFKYPKFNIGAYLELPGKTPLYKSPILAELTIGLNISAIKFGPAGYNHW